MPKKLLQIVVRREEGREEGSLDIECGMAFKIKQIPTLIGHEAKRFLKIADHNFSIRGSIDFSEQATEGLKILKKSRLK